MPRSDRPSTSIDTPRKITVVLDANALIRDPQLDGTALSALLSSSAIGVIDVAVPEIALQEAIHHFRDQVAKAYAEIQKQLKVLDRLGVTTQLQMAQAEAAGEAHEAELRRWIRKSQVQILEYPKVGHREITQMAIEKRRPFDERGRGYQDTLIWASVMELVTATDVWFISGDRGFQAQGSEELAPVLVRDIQAMGQEQSAVRLFPNVTDCVTELGNSILKPKGDISKRFRDDQAYLDRVLEAIDTELIWSSVDTSELSHPLSSAELGSIDSFQGIDQVYVEDARQLPNGELFVRLDTIVQVELELLIDKSEIASIESAIGGSIRVAEWDFNPRYMSAFASARANVFLSAIADSQTLDFKRIDVDKYTFDLGDLTTDR